MKLKFELIDNEGKIFEGETELIQKGKKKKIQTKNVSKWYKEGSTIEKIVQLIENGFFTNSKSIAEIIDELKSKDYHFKSSDLTLPLRNIVRKGLLKRTKDLPSDNKSKKWLYIQE